ncbi:MAG TPA: MFS transporter [candidate division Zixibacteria bacterium]|nr:MFS transporter [candidate division Zixibacteria bacterium]
MSFPVSRDGWLLLATCAVRSFAYGFLSVVLGLHLDALGLSATAIGWIFAAALGGGAAMTIAVSAVADRWGRRAFLVVGALLMSLAGWIFATNDDPLLLAAAAVFGTVSPSGKEVGPFLSIEQAILPQTTRDEHRTAVFAAYNLVGSLAGAAGALAVGLPAWFSPEAASGYGFLVRCYAASGLVLAFLFALLSPEAEAQRRSVAAHGAGLKRSRGIVAKLAGLFALDAFAGGFVVQSIVAYWFHLRYQADLNALGGIFFGTNFLAALSFLAAPPFARRFGLLNTMVFTHLPSNVLLAAVAFMPTFESAAAVLLARHLLSQMDVPTRQSYTMAVVDPTERAASAGVLSVARNAGAAAAPLFTGAMLSNPALGLPFLLAGGLKIVYDLWILAAFRGIKPPEERADGKGSPG